MSAGVISEEERTPFSRQVVANDENGERLLFEMVTGAPTSGSGFERFEREVATVSLLGHPCVLDAVDVTVLADGTTAVVSPLPDGVSLARWMSEGGSLTAASALDLVTGLAGALAAAHQRGISHGCVCAQHVFLAGTGPDDAPVPRLHGFAQRWLVPGAGNDEADQSRTREAREEDVRGLARIAGLLLAAADPALPAEVQPVLASIVDGQEPPTPLAFAEALASVVERAEPPRDHPPAAPSDSTHRRRLPPLARGLAAGAVFAVVAVLIGVSLPVPLQPVADGPSDGALSSWESPLPIGTPPAASGPVETLMKAAALPSPEPLPVAAPHRRHREHRSPVAPAAPPPPDPVVPPSVALVEPAPPSPEARTEAPESEASSNTAPDQPPPPENKATP